MDTPKYITFQRTKDGRIYKVRPEVNPTPNSINGPRFVGVVFDGRGRVMDTVHAEKIEDINPRTIRAWMRAQETWASSQRVKDPPMWDRYERFVENNEVIYKRDR